MGEQAAERGAVRVGFRYRDGEVLSPEREAQSEDIEIPEAVIDVGDGEWLTLAELRDMHAERLEHDMDAWESSPADHTPRAEQGAESEEGL